MTEKNKGGSKRKMKGQSKGITLIALVITIILLLILAGITLSQLTGENGLFAKAKEARKEAEIAEYKEALEMIGYDLSVEKITKGLSSEEYIQRYKEEIEKDNKLKGKVQITDNEDGSINVTTKEGYIFKVTEKGVEYIGNDGENGGNTGEEENKEGITVDESSPVSVYAKLYTDGTLMLSSKSCIDNSKTISEDYGDVSNVSSYPGWIEYKNYKYKNKATNIIIYDAIAPRNMEYWFYELGVTELDLVMLVIWEICLVNVVI